MTNHLFSKELFSNTSLNQVSQVNQVTKSIKKNLIMQNKPNLCVFWAVSGDCEEKQTQTNPIQTQNKANSDLSATPQTQNKPNSNPIKPNSSPNKPNPPALNFSSDFRLYF